MFFICQIINHNVYWSLYVFVLSLAKGSKACKRLYFKLRVFATVLICNQKEFTDIQKMLKPQKEIFVVRKLSHHYLQPQKIRCQIFWRIISTLKCCWLPVWFTIETNKIDITIDKYSQHLDKNVVLDMPFKSSFINYNHKEL